LTAKEALARLQAQWTMDSHPLDPPARGAVWGVRNVTDDEARVHGWKIGHGVSRLRNGAITRLRQLNDRSVPDARQAMVAQPALAFALLGA
jgi:hypothetical protein